MRISKVQLFLFVACVLMNAAAHPASAQQSTTATFQDWILQCEIKDGSPSRKTCVIAQTSQVQNKNLPFSRVIVERPVKGHPTNLAVQVPVNISIAANVRVQLSNADPALSAPFEFCIPAGCFAKFALKDETLQKFRAANGVGKISFKDAGGHDVNVPLSFKGFRQGLDRLAKE